MATDDSVFVVVYGRRGGAADSSVRDGSSATDSMSGDWQIICSGELSPPPQKKSLPKSAMPFESRGTVGGAGSSRDASASPGIGDLSEEELARHYIGALRALLPTCRSSNVARSYSQNMQRVRVNFGTFFMTWYCDGVQESFVFFVLCFTITMFQIVQREVFSAR